MRRRSSSVTVSRRSVSEVLAEDILTIEVDEDFDEPAAPASIPTSVEVAHISYRIDHNGQRARDAEVYGMCHVDRAEIVIGTSMAPAQKRDTLLHELLHALCDVMGVSKGGSAALLPTQDDEERFVHALSPLLLDMLRSNPELVDFLLAEDG